MKAASGFTPARIVALVVIGVLVSGLAYVRFAPGDETISVQAGARAGDLTMHACTYETETGPMPADCGTLVVPENRADPASRLIALPVTRVRSRSPHPAEPVFPLWGGPGISNMNWTQASRFAGAHDVVLVGYRGVDGSVRLDCPEVTSALGHSTDILSEASFRAYADGFRSCANRLTHDGVDLAGYGLVQQVDDLEAARVALGYDRVDLLSESAGTRTAMIYAWRHPESIHRSVMVGVNPPGNFMWHADTTDEQIGRYAALCAEDEGCRERTDDLAASIRRTGADMPDRWFFLPIREGNARVLSFFGLMESTSAAGPASGPTVLDAWLSAAEGDASGLWFASFFADLLVPKMFVWGQYASAGRVDAQAARDYFAAGGRERGPNLDRDTNSFVWGGGRMIDAWPAASEEGTYRRVRTSDVETLLIGGTLDGSTPPQIAAEELLPHMPNGKQVVLAELGHTADFWSYQPGASSRLINTFFDSGRVDDSGYEPARVDFTPAVTLTVIAKIVAGSLVGLALITVLSLVWMAGRVHKRGRIGRKAGATLRSLYAIVFGIGGWALGVLIVVTIAPSVPLDDEVFTALSVGVPIGLGVYLAWVNRERTTSTKTTGLVAAMGGALVGASMGFNATEGLLALVTAIVGSAVGANLLVILLDIAEAGRADRSSSAPVRAVRVPERVDA
jgi:pimeloyl-ACP methyl ester carboxylesterase